MAMLEALAAAHAAGIVHRDVKPENIFLHRHPDGQEQVKLVDFGIAKSPMQQSNTRTDVGLGTPYYMSPEQATSARDVTPAADVWSVGVILYWLLSGRLPFNGETPFATLTQVCTADLPPLDVHEGQTNRDLVALTQAMLCKDPRRRPQSAGVLVVALHQILGTGASETSQSRLRFTSSLNLQRAWSTQGTIAPKVSTPSPINYDAPRQNRRWRVPP
jgi:serine/threonine protein kinase